MSGLKIRTDNDGRLDEVRGPAHLEDMGNGDWSLVFEDGDDRLQIFISGPMLVVSAGRATGVYLGTDAEKYENKGQVGQ